MNEFFSKIARLASNVIARPVVFLLAVLSVLLWALAGPFLHYSQGWQLVINTATTILTFLMVFLLQNTQNHDTRAIHVKLDELLRAIAEARTEMVDLENMSEAELAKYSEEFRTLHVRAAGLLQGRNRGQGQPSLEEKKTATKRRRLRLTPVKRGTGTRAATRAGDEGLAAG